MKTSMKPICYPNNNQHRDHYLPTTSWFYLNKYLPRNIPMQINKLRTAPTNSWSVQKVILPWLLIYFNASTAPILLLNLITSHHRHRHRHRHRLTHELQSFTLVKVQWRNFAVISQVLYHKTFAKSVLGWLLQFNTIAMAQPPITSMLILPVTVLSRQVLLQEFYGNYHYCSSFVVVKCKTSSVSEFKTRATRW